MRITDWCYINWCNPEVEFTFGIHGDKTMAAWSPEESDDYDDVEFEEMNRLIIGFLFFSITILY